VIDLSAGTAARLSSPLNGAFTAVDPTLVWADWSSAVAYARDAEARRSKVLFGNNQQLETRLPSLRIEPR
jgi:hypothetical protein